MSEEQEQERVVTIHTFRPVQAFGRRCFRVEASGSLEAYLETGIEVIKLQIGEDGRWVVYIAA
jgi:hypothetical protein